MTLFRSFCLTALTFLLCQCASSPGSSVLKASGGPPNMGGPSAQERTVAIKSEPTGNFYYGRRYLVQKTRFWGYLREPRQPASKAKLVIFEESAKRSPDRKSETGPSGSRYGFDHNYEYRISGNYTGREAYEPNSNQFLPIFRLTNYQLLDKNPGWLFSPKDHYDPYRLTLAPR